jgi:hypothetical protein
VGVRPTNVDLATQLDVGIGTACDPGCGQPTVSMTWNSPARPTCVRMTSRGLTCMAVPGVGAIQPLTQPGLAWPLGGGRVGVTAPRGRCDG